MNAKEVQLLENETGDSEPHLSIRTKTRIDLGQWFRRSFVWLCLTGSELVLVAANRRHYVERISVSECQSSYYDHASGKLVLEPASSLMTKSLSLSPRDALIVLEKLLNQNKQTKEQTC
ncbi:MAG: hypothetical protein HN494_05430 [Opitutae bacterium]|jgi:hypothetical protein|nr:hypothetical protein [Opitutae bacterium]MBT4665238.1 hypothetical protein [Opitutae bacterium]MBT5908246.1 hypothetical protein [Opitutae bacterium]MBT6852543.1 hypothetical protein [Opitutae bacterium]MBT7741999.1 hypothetical protein [Opitutae bacterium]